VAPPPPPHHFTLMTFGNVQYIYREGKKPKKPKKSDYNPFSVKITQF
jgi:hypothetical protein